MALLAGERLMAFFEQPVQFSVFTCPRTTCGISFAMAASYVKDKRQDHSTFWCPNGHPQSFTGQTEEEKLRLERDRLTQRIAEKNDAITALENSKAAVERRLSVTKGIVTRTKRRVGQGMCPCCTRPFKSLKKHMEHAHPEYKTPPAA